MRPRVAALNPNPYPNPNPNPNPNASPTLTLSLFAALHTQAGLTTSISPISARLRPRPRTRWWTGCPRSRRSESSRRYCGVRGRASAAAAAPAARSGRALARIVLANADGALSLVPRFYCARLARRPCPVAPLAACLLGLDSNVRACLLYSECCLGAVPHSATGHRPTRLYYPVLYTRTGRTQLTANSLTGGRPVLSPIAGCNNTSHIHRRFNRYGHPPTDTHARARRTPTS